MFRFLLLLELLFYQSFLIPQINTPGFSEKAGFYSSPVTLQLQCNAGERIFYTIDGSEPTLGSKLYNGSIIIDTTTVIRARSFLSDTTFSKVKTRTYFISERSVLPVVSLSTDPKNLWDTKTGIYIYPNYGYDWEIPVHIEFFETDGDRKLDMDAGAKVFGESSRMWPQKSLAIFARSEYGEGTIKCRFFPDINIDEFENIVLRNGGSDWNMSMFRDEFMQTSVSTKNIDRSAYRQSIMFLNGVYWGIHNIREKTDEHYLHSHYGVAAENLDLVLYWGIQPEIGDFKQWDILTSQVYKDLSVQANYDTVCKYMDIDEFITYITTNIFFDNTDWPSNNVKAWRPEIPGAKWRWILHDTDCGLDLRLRKSYTHRSLDHACSFWGVDFWNYPASIKFQVNLLKNPTFRTEFINRFADFTNTIFSKDTLLKLFEEFKERIRPEIPRHFAKWQDTLARWDKHLAAIETFIKERFIYIQLNYMQKFDLRGATSVTADVNDPYAGKIILNSLSLNSFPWKGTYFFDVPIKMTAVPAPGYIFKKWDGEMDSDSASITLTPEKPVNIAAIFVPDPGIPKVYINEINYNSASDFDTEDWVELYNDEYFDVDISEWNFRDSDPAHSYIVPDSTILKGKGFIILCRDTSRFSNLNPAIKNYVGDFSFAMNNDGESILLFDRNGNFVDSVNYDDNLPWPADADGNGGTLELKNSSFNNSSPLSWKVSSGHGSPGKLNGLTEETSIPDKFLISRNYPNPFNSGTVIEYQVPVYSKVVIKVYTMLGETAAELVNSEKVPGFYKVNFSAGNLSSGIYLYTIEAAGKSGELFRSTGKMIHMK